MNYMWNQMWKVCESCWRNNVGEKLIIKIRCENKHNYQPCNTKCKPEEASARCQTCLEWPHAKYKWIVIFECEFFCLIECLIDVTEADRRDLEKIETKEQGERKRAQEYHEIPQGKRRSITKPGLKFWKYKTQFCFIYLFFLSFFLSFLCKKKKKKKESPWVCEKCCKNDTFFFFELELIIII